MEEYEYTLTPQAALIDNDTEAIRNLANATELILATVSEILGSYKDVPGDLWEALHISEQAIESVNMYVERMGK